MEMALERNPSNPPWYHWVRGGLLYLAGRYDDALAALARWRFNLMLLLSVHSLWRMWPTGPLPRFPGIELLKQMRAANIQVPVLVVSGSMVAQEEALANGAFAFILKPPDLAELNRLVALALAADRQGLAGE